MIEARVNELLNRQKRKQLEAMLRMGRGLVMVHLDPRRDGVVVPESFARDPVLRLKLAYGFNLPAFDIGDEHVYAVLSFSGRPFGCTLPWSAIFALTRPDEGHEGIVWPDSAPPELRPSLLPPPRCAHGAVLTSEASAEEGGREHDPSRADAGGPLLRLVKQEVGR